MDNMTTTERAATYQPMATVHNGKVIKVEATDDPNESVKCDRCGRMFQIKHVYCVCKG